MTLTEIFALIQAVSFVFTAGAALQIYRMQKKDSAESNKREARVRLTQAYCQFNTENLRSKDNISAMQDLVYPQYSVHQVERIEFMFLMMNTLYLEWNFYKDHTQSEEQFNATMESWMKPVAKNIKNRSPQNSFLIDDFEKIFVDFPDDFNKAILNCIRSVYDE
jgi:hypothetical protein